VLSAFSNSAIQKERVKTGKWDKVQTTINNFTDSEQLLDSLNIDSESKILVIDSYTTNIPLILMNRKGYTVVNANADNIERSLAWNYDYVVLQDELILSDIVRVFPEIQEYLMRIAGNGKISVYTRITKRQELIKFIGIDREKPIYEATCSFAASDSSAWNYEQYEAVLKDDSYGFSGFDHPFGATLEIESDSLFNKKRYLVFSADFYKYNHNKNFWMVVQVKENGHELYYETINLKHKYTSIRKIYYYKN